MSAPLNQGNGTGSEAASSWRAVAIDVAGPSRRGGRPDQAVAGDRGQLWISSGSLCFAGRRESWSVPLGWFAAPETDLAGITHLRIQTADHGRDLAFRLQQGADDESGLAAAILEARIVDPDPRDRRALESLVALLQPQLAGLEGAESDAESPYGAAARRLRSLWLPYWGAPATRLRDATLGALTARDEAVGPEADSGAAERAERAQRRLQNVCEDLKEWCGVPAGDDLAPLVELPQADGSGARLPQPAQPAERPAAAAALPPAASPQGAPAPAPAAEPVYVAPPAPSVPAYTPPAPEPAPPEEEVSETLIFGRQTTPEPPDEDQTLIAPPPRSEPATPGSRPFDVTSEPSAVVSGPGRKGSGGMTMLYRRSGSGATGSIARKELQAQALTQPDVEPIFLEIGRRFATVQHPNFVHLYGSGRDGSSGLAYIDMEFVEGESVSARQRRGALPAAQALTIIEQLAGAIDAVHRAGLVHGDIRPQNVLIEPAGRTVLLEPSVAVDHTLEHRRGTIYGELPYLTRERVRGEPEVPPSDIYALGTIAYALLAGRPPWDGEAAAIFAGHEDEPPPRIAPLVPGIPAEVDQLLAAALAKRPADRPPSASAFAGALRGVFSGQASPRPQAPAAQPPQPAWPQAPSPIPAQQLPPQAPSPMPARQPQPSAPPTPPPPTQPNEAVQPPRPRSPSPLGAPSPPRPPSPLGTPHPPPPPPAREDSDDDNDDDRTIIVRPR